MKNPCYKMNKFYLAKLAYWDPIMFPILFATSVLVKLLYQIKSDPRGIEIGLREHFLSLDEPWSILKLICIVMSILNSIWLNRTLKLRDARLVRYFWFRLFLMLAFFTFKKIDRRTTLELTTFVWALILSTFLSNCYGIQSVLEKLEEFYYYQMRKSDSDPGTAKVYQRKFTLFGIPVVHLLYAQIFSTLRYIQFSIWKLLDWLRSRSEHNKIDLGSDLLYILTSIAQALFVFTLLVNSLALLTALRKKSIKLLIIYYHVRTIALLGARCAGWVAGARERALFGKRTTSFSRGIYVMVSVLWEFFELAQVLRYHTYLRLEAEMPVEDHHQSSDVKYLRNQKNEKDFFLILESHDKQTQKFANSIRIASWRVLTAPVTRFCSTHAPSTCSPVRSLSKLDDSRLRRVEGAGVLEYRAIKTWKGEYLISCNLHTDGKILGKGNFSTVYIGSMISILPIRINWRPRISVAIKAMKFTSLVPFFEHILSEIRILEFVSRAKFTGLGHPNLVRFIGICKLPLEYGGKDRLVLVSEYLEGGNLLDRLHKMRNGFKNLALKMSTWSQEIANGMDYLSSKKIIHGDLAARNILLTGEDVCKISDFGMSFRLHQYQTYATSTHAKLPFRWMAPESLSDMKFSIQTDVWSYAVLVWEIYSLGIVPWATIQWSSEFVLDLKYNLRLAKPILASEKIYFEMMMQCWKQDPIDRLTFKNIREFWDINNNEIQR